MMARTAAGASSGGPIAIALVVAVAENGVIGQGGGLPWRLKSDLQHFRRVTMGGPVVMGRKTYLSIGRPLPGRTTIVASRNPCFAAAGVVVAPDLARALAVARADALRRGWASIAVVGGAGIFAEAMPLANRLVLTRVHLSPQGDTFMPPIGPEWVETSCVAHAAGLDDMAAFDIVTLERPCRDDRSR